MAFEWSIYKSIALKPLSPSFNDFIGLRLWCPLCNHDTHCVVSWRVPLLELHVVTPYIHVGVVFMALIWLFTVCMYISGALRHVHVQALKAPRWCNSKTKGATCIKLQQMFVNNNIYDHTHKQGHVMYSGRVPFILNVTCLTSNGKELANRETLDLRQTVKEVVKSFRMATYVTLD